MSPKAELQQELERRRADKNETIYEIGRLREVRTRRVLCNVERRSFYFHRLSWKKLQKEFGCEDLVSQ